jgi:hypothetical protein
MSVYKVERKVDTVIIEMDSSNAEALLEVLVGVEDLATMSPISALAKALRESGEIREPSPLYEFDPFGAALVNRSSESYEKAYEEFHGTLDVCGECGGKTNKHYLSCSTWGFRAVGKA